MPIMPIIESVRTAAAIHRKLRGLAAVFSDPAATEHEKANAERLKTRLEEQLPPEPAPSAASTNIMFRLGRGVRGLTALSKARLDRSCVSAGQNAP